MFFRPARSQSSASPRSSGSRALLTATAVLSTVLLSSCAALPEVFPGAAAAAAPAPSAAVTPTPSPTPIPKTPGELDGGTVSHSLPAGAQTLMLTYWTAQDPASWTPAMSVPVNFSARLDGADPKRAYKVTRVTATTLGTQPIELLNDRGEFVITPPYSYDSALVIPPGSSTTVKVRVLVDLLVETSAGSGSYSRVTVLDTLQLGLAAGSAG